MSRKGQSITLSISDEDKTQLEAIARELGVMRGDRANISGLVEAIARQQFLVAANIDWSETRISALWQAVQALIDTGQVKEAQAIASLLLERSELQPPMREQVERFLQSPPLAWRKEIDRYLLRQQPFQISYHDAADRLWSFTIRYAQITLHEQRQYLDCWCEETQGNKDLPELIHNWCLRLDRIPEATVVPIEGYWRTQMDYIDVEMHMLKGLAFAYQAKPRDSANDWLPDQPRVRRVVRKVSSTFWFLREVMRYGDDCIIVSPESIRERVKQKLRLQCQQYDMEIRD